MDKEEARAKVSALVSKFTQMDRDGKLARMSESDTKAIFIEPLFEVLGWAMQNYDEVSREKQVLRGRADYAFRLSGVVRFFVEAKAAGVELEEKEAWQAINYSYMKSVPWAVLTNFRELAIYNADWQSKKSEESRFLKFSAYDYAQNFDDLWLLSRESILAGEIDRKAERYGKKSVREPVTKALYEDLREWRSKLSKNVAKNDPRRKLSKEQVDEGVQRFLNRLIFIRTCEDRHLENERLQEALRTYGKDGKRRLISYVRDIFEEFNLTYDSDIFAPHMAGDMLLDNDVLAEVIGGMYESPQGAHYDFDAIDADVLGNIYEQYLATVMREGGGLLEREGKRKEMGIYYTPTYIVDYIVKNTLGELVARAKSAGELERIRVLDPACGSGSFLIRAYEVLSEAYLQKNGGDHEMLGENLSRNAYSILNKNLHGVDLDSKAIEIAELNLLLRAARRQGLLPMLKDNIKRGNSLISGTEEELKGFFGENWRERHPFNWETEFKEVMDSGGFDIVVGNPPYIQLSMDSKTSEALKNYLINKYGSSMGRLNTFGFFIKRAIMLLKDGGYLGFIIPNTLLTQEYYEALREDILNSCKIECIINFSELPFQEAVVENIILILKKTDDERERVLNKIEVFSVASENKFVEKNIVLQKDFYSNYKKTFNIYTDKRVTRFKQKLDDNSRPLGHFLEINQAIALKEDRSKYLSEKKVDASYKKVLDGRNINRYSLYWGGHYLRYVPSAIHSCKREDIFLSPQKIFFRRVGERLIASLDDQKHYALNTLIVMNLKEGISTDLRFFLALFNSNLLNYYYQTFLKSTKRVFSEIQTRQVRNLPIHLVSPAEQQPIIKLVDRMLELNRKLVEMGEVQTSERQHVEEEIRRTDAQIDELVYKLYGITEEEKKVIEESFGK